MTMDQYVNEVMNHVYAPSAQLERFEIWLRNRIHRCRETGREFEQIFMELGTPEEVAREMMFAGSRHSVTYAGVIRRVPAFLIDLVICFLMTSPALILGIALLEASDGFPPFVIMFLAGMIAGLLTWVAYFTLKEGRTGQTIGKKFLGLRVIRTDGSPITHKDALIRTLFLFTPFALFDLAVLLFNRKRRRAADMVAGTLVVRD